MALVIFCVLRMLVIWVRIGAGECFQRLLHFGLDLVVPVAGLVDLVHQVAVIGPHVGVQPLLEGQQLLLVHVVGEALVDGVESRTHLSHGQRRILGLLEKLRNALAPVQLLACGLVQVRGELGEGRQLTVLGEC
jgi:hypothetical protein